MSTGVSHRAYAIFQVKSVDAEQRVIEGIATTPTPDRVGDIIEPLGIRAADTLPLLLHHRSDLPVGLVQFGTPTKSGVPFRARLPAIAEPGTLRDRVEEAWQSVKYRLVSGVSIGFRALKDGVERLKDSSGLRFTAIEVLELSLVTIPANADAQITLIRSLDAAQRAASGEAAPVEPSLSPGATGSYRLPPKDAATMTNFSDQITQFKAARAPKLTRLDEIMQRAVEDGRTLDAAEKTEYDALTTEVKDIDEHVARLEALEAAKAQTAKPVGYPPTSTPTTPHIEVRSTLPPGMEFVRAVICRMAALKTGESPVEIAKARYRDNPRVAQFLKTAVAGGTTTDSTWAGPLVEPTTLASEFVEYLRPMTIVGKFGTGNIPSLRRVPFNIRVVGQTSGGTGYWVGQQVQKPLTKFDFAPATLTFAKVAAITVISDELARFSTPSAEGLVRDGLRDALVEVIDRTFIDPGVFAEANVSPASILNGVAGLTPSGTNADAVRADVKQVFSAFINASLTPTTGVWIMSQTTALTLSLMQNMLGQPEFPGITMMGGTFFGLPVITSQYATKSSSPGVEFVALVNAQDIFLADDGGVNVDVSREASIEMEDDPANQSGTVVSMYQTNQMAIRAERYITWQRRRAAAVAWVDDVEYGLASN